MAHYAKFRVRPTSWYKLMHLKQTVFFQRKVLFPDDYEVCKGNMISTE